MEKALTRKKMKRVAAFMAMYPRTDIDLLMDVADDDLPLSRRVEQALKMADKACKANFTIDHKRVAEMIVVADAPKIKPRNGNKWWTMEEKMELVRLKEQGYSLKEIAHLLGRSAGGVYQQAKHLDNDEQLILGEADDYDNQ